METLEIKPEPRSPVIFEQDQHLSRSMLWELQRKFFARQGVDAWRQGMVPYYITHPPFIASARAQAIGPDEIGAQVAQSMYHSLTGHDQPSGLARRSIE